MSSADSRRAGVLRHFTDELLAVEDVIPVLVEFRSPPVAALRAANPAARDQDLEDHAARLDQEHRQFLQELAAQGIDARISYTTALEQQGDSLVPRVIRHQFTFLFNGLGLLVPGRSVQQIIGHPAVRSVTHNAERAYLHLDRSVPWIGAPKVWEMQDAQGRPITGQGIRIAVIDTGVDWTHPALGGHPEVPNDKVIYAVSYTGEPPRDNFGHGTHVAATAAGDRYAGTPRGDSKVRGVAPGAQILSYKVLTAYGSGSAANIILAIEDAVRRGAHVINLSLGDPSGDPRSPEAVAANNAMLAGVVVVAAAGNSGPRPRTVGTPGSAEHVLTVGASTDDGVTSLFARVPLADGSQRQLEMRPMAGSVPIPAGGIRQQWVLCGQGLRPTDFPPAVKGRIALVQRGRNTFKEKAQLAAAAGAVACVIDNNQPGNFFGTLGEDTPDSPIPKIPVVAISQEDGQVLRQQPVGDDGASRMALFLDPEPVPQPDRLAEFSSRGPTLDGRIKPDLCAPGVDIYAPTITPDMAPGPGYNNMADPSGYISASGTSMATPHVAGAAALLRQARPQWDALTVKAVLMNTAVPMPGQGGPNDQGAGRIDLPRAMAARHMLVAAGTQAPSHFFGRVVADGGRARLTQEFRVVDLGGKEPARLRLRVQWLQRAPGLRAYLSARELILPPGGSVGFTLTLQVRPALVPAGTYSGLVVAEGQGVYRLPFAITVVEGTSDPVQPDPAGSGNQGGEPGVPDPGLRPGRLPDV